MKKLALIGAVLAALASISAAGAARTSASLIFNRQIGTVWIDESQTRVEYQFGLGRKVGGCGVLLKSGCASLRRYSSPGLFVGFHGGKVVSVQTNSTQYATADGLGVGYKIPLAKKTTLDGTVFTYHGYNQPFSCGCWLGFSKTGGTILSIRHAAISAVWIFRRDVILQ
ncbi:MAG: hypothetical protein ACRDQZ_19010 [Mycobacteriales bacterium]